MFSVHNNQRGAVLIVALVILLVITALGAAAMRSATLEMRMANNSQTRQRAFNAAEAALRRAEAWVENNHSVTHADIGCTGSGCYTSSCTDGYCFDGAWSSGGPYNCDIDPAVNAEKPWESTTRDVWSNNAKHESFNLNGYSNNPKYIIEFRCFQDCPAPVSPATTSSGECNPLFRITALGSSDNDTMKVMLQSIYRGPGS